ncbi:hypothetical protein HPP92_014833 [Vanilla planifolia]|uniref:HMA domain-containing protein n=1 Tax=Vanilla planifolia TaxID=51239 RepID=A0A835UV54_VANPL|nr:hypothetical protein HPP92_014833 [Vanilla planifolia]
MASGSEASEHLKCQVRPYMDSISSPSSLPFSIETGTFGVISDLGFESFDSLRRMQEEGFFLHVRLGISKKVCCIVYDSSGVYKSTIDCQQQKVVVTGNVAVDTLVKKLFKIGKHAELWPEIRPTAENTISATAAEEKKNKKKTSNLGMPSGNPEKSSKKDDTSPTEKKAELQKELNGDDGDKTCCNVRGKMKGNKSLKNSGAASNGEAKYIKGVRGILPIQERPNACHFPAYTSQPPEYLVSYITSPAPVGSYGGTHYRLPTQQSSFPSYSCHLPLTGPYNIPVTVSSSVSYDLFSEESTDVCSVM